MKTVGIIGGIGPESTIEYYRLIIKAYRERNRDGTYPRIVINSIDMTRMLDLIGTGRLAEVADYLLVEVKRLAGAGADFALLASNTPHIVFGALSERSPIPLVSIVDTACEAARDRGFTRPALFGTRFTMEGPFYPRAFEKAGIALIIPAPEERAYIHDKYMNELVHGIILPETREKLIAIADRMRTEEKADALILGGTELPLILKEGDYKEMPLLDTTKLHVEEAVSRILA
jgi:aspartate racemase